MKILITCLFVLFLASNIGADSKKTPAAKSDPAANINEPRADARRISFDTNVGTWMSVDISPDGKTIVFDLLGDIYSMPVSGGKATVISSGPAYDYHPRYSPDGKTIAFTSDRNGMENLWLMDADGKNPRALTDGKDDYVRSAAWTPDGNYLVARKEDAKRAGIPPVELWMYSRYGGSGIKLTSADEVNNASGPVVSPDGRYIYFSAREVRYSYTPDLTNGLWQISRFDRETGDTLPLTEGFGGAARPAISHDGKTLVFISRHDANTVMIMRDLASGREKTLLKGITRDEQEGFAQMDIWPNYAFSPDDKSIIFSDRGKIKKLEIATSNVSEISFQANVVQYAAPRVAWQEKVESGDIKARILRWPSQSPDQKWILFDAMGRIWLQQIKGKDLVGAPRRLTQDAADSPRREYSPAFSPDGKWIVYVTWNDAAGGQVWKAPVPTGSETVQPVQLTKSAGHYVNPEFSPKNDKIVVIQGSGLEFRGRQPEEEEFFHVGWLPAEGGEVQFVTTVKLAESLKFHPQAFWNAKGDRIFLREPIERQKPTDDPKNDLISVRLDGTDKKHYLRFPAVSDVVPSPDEQWVVFTSRDNVYVTALPDVQMKEPPEVGLKEGSVPVWRLSDEAGGYVGWADNGKTITWGLANTFHRLPVTAAIKFVEDQKKKDQEKDKKEGAEKKDVKEEMESLRVPQSDAIQISLIVPRYTPKGSIVLHGARVISMKGDQVLENADVVVTDNRIAAVGESGKVTVPAGAKEIDAHGKTIIPGLIDTHAHLHYSGFELFPDNKWEYIANLAYGVTTTYDPSAPSLDVFAQGEMVEAGLMTGPRIYSSGDVLYGGQQEDFFAEVNNLEDAQRQVRRMKAYGARMIKVYQQPRREQRVWFAQACRDQHMLLTAEGAGELMTDLSMTLDGFTAFEHSLPVELQNDVVQLVAKSETFYTPTLIVSYGGPWGEEYFWQARNPHDDAKLNRFVPHLYIDRNGRRHPWISPDEYQFPNVARGVAQVDLAGGNTSLGAHGQLQGLGAHWELWMMAGEDQPEGGHAMSPLHALKASTLLAAQKIGFGPDLGSIEPGKLADMIVLDANPLEDIHNTEKIAYVIKNGVLYEAGTMKEIWPEEKALPAFFWAMK